VIRVNDQIALEESEIQFEFTRAGGPGGQNVNKVSTAVQLRFDVRHSPSLPGSVRRRLIVLAGRRLTSDGVLVIDARSERSQERNRQEALDRLVELIRRAARKPKRRRRTRPTAASRERRLQGKRERAGKKRMRARPSME